MRGKAFIPTAALGIALIAVAVFAGYGPSGLAALLFTPQELYHGRAIVTGQRDETRRPGFERSLADVARKLTGDHRIQWRDIEPMLEAPIAAYVARYSEADRMAGIPIHDEQGTRDRPFDLLAEFKPRMVDRLIKRMGLEAWKAPRPTVLVLLRVTTDAGTHMLSDDGDQGIDQREALKNAAWTAGIPILLPYQEQMDLARGNSIQLTAETGADKALTGSIAWTQGMKGWQAQWTLSGAQESWGIKDVNFDEAFRDAMRGAAAILARSDSHADAAS